jgi:hypothetical protein
MSEGTRFFGKSDRIGETEPEQIYACIVALKTEGDATLIGAAIAQQLDFRGKFFIVSSRNVEKLQLTVGCLIESEKRAGGGLVVRRANTVCNQAGPPEKYYRSTARIAREERKQAA